MTSVTSLHEYSLKKGQFPEDLLTGVLPWGTVVVAGTLVTGEELAGAVVWGAGVIPDPPVTSAHTPSVQIRVKRPDT